MSIPQIGNEMNTLFLIAKKMGDRSGKCYAIVNKKNEILYVNDRLLQLTGFTREYMENLHYLKLTEKTKEMSELDRINRRISSGKMTRTNIVHKRKTGPSFYAEIECIPFMNLQDETEIVLFFIRDITYKQLYDFMSRIEQEMYTAIQDGRTFLEKLQVICNGIDTMFFQKSLTSILYKQQEKLSIIHSNSYLQSTPVEVTNPKEMMFYNNVINGREILVYDYISSLPFYRPQKEIAVDMRLNCIALIPIVLQDKQPLGLISIIFDEQYINEEEYYRFFYKLVHLISLAYTYELKQREIYELAYFDKYIAIPNRHGFINKVVERQQLNSEQFIQIIEPGNFSKIVELYGRDAGDELLKQIYERFISRYSTVIPLVGRLSSSSLIVYIDSQNFDRDNVEQFLRELAQHPFVIANKRMYVTLKCGVSFKTQANKLEDTIRQAERALADAKLRAGTVTSFYTPLKDQQLEREVEILNHLMEALKTKSFEVYFQPKIELHRGRIASMEALSRWHSPVLGNISPMEFIPIAERAGIVHEIDLQIIEQVLQWQQRRQYEGKRIVPIAVNISPEHFYHPNFVKNLVELVQKYYADPHYLVIEITESIGLVDVERASEILKQLYLRGFKTSIDDFGIGYSSLSYLQKLNFSELKIDRSFVMKLDQIGTKAIVKSIIEIAKVLEVTVVAEGVEWEWQLQELKDLGCYSVQGYYHYKPMSFEELEQRNLLDKPNNGVNT